MASWLDQAAQGCVQVSSEVSRDEDPAGSVSGLLPHTTLLCSFPGERKAAWRTRCQRLGADVCHVAKGMGKPQEPSLPARSGALFGAGLQIAELCPKEKLREGTGEREKNQNEW